MEPRWAPLELGQEPDDSELSPVYDFNTRRPHWKEWRQYTKGRNGRSLLQVGIWILLLFLTALFMGLYIAGRQSSASNSAETVEAVGPKNAREEPDIHLLYKDDDYDPFVDFTLDVDSRGVDRSQISDKGMVATDHGDCSDLAGKVLNDGGNAVDAAVTAMLCIGIRHPMSSGTGGGGFLLVRLPNGTATAIDAREVAPGNSSKNMFEGRGVVESEVGGLAIGVPLELKGMETMWKLYGRMKWKRLVELVIPMARDGFPADPYLLISIRNANRWKIGQAVFKDIRETFTIYEDGQWRLPRVGEMCCKRPALAKTLELIAEKGAQSVYESKWGDDLAGDIRSFLLPGIITKKDLVDARPMTKEPIKGRVFGKDMLTMPPPSSAATLVMALKLMETYTDTNDTTLNAHRLLQAMRHMFAVRSHFGDPGKNNTFLDLDQILKDIITNEYALELRKGTSDEATEKPSFYGGKYKFVDDISKESGTSQISVMDEDGVAVSVTTSINCVFGSFMISKKTGLLLNNHMNDFAQPGIIIDGKPHLITQSSNFIQPGRKPLSSMSPSIFVDDDGKPRLTIGCSGGRFILGTLLQVIYNHLGRGVDLEDAVNSPRIYDIPPEKTICEDLPRGSFQFKVDEQVLLALNRTGFDVADEGIPNFSPVTGAVGIAGSGDGLFEGVADPRKDGAAASNMDK